MRKGDTVEIKNEIDMDLECCQTPGWDRHMEKFCGKNLTIKKIVKGKPWVYFEEDEWWVWHFDWLITEEMIKFKDEDFNI